MVNLIFNKLYKINMSKKKGKGKKDEDVLGELTEMYLFITPNKLFKGKNKIRSIYKRFRNKII